MVLWARRVLTSGAKARVCIAPDAALKRRSSTQPKKIDLTHSLARRGPEDVMQTLPDPARIQERGVLLVSPEHMLLQPGLQKKQKLNRNSRLSGAVFLKKSHHLLTKHLMLNPVSRQSGKFVPFHQ